MKSITTTAIVALMTATIGLSAAVPAFAQDAPPPRPQAQELSKGPGAHARHGEAGPRMGGERMGGPRGSFLDLNNPEAVEIALVRLSYQLELTPEQQPLFDTFRTEALAAAQDFSGVLEGVRPAAPVAGATRERPTMGEMLSNRIAVTTAELAALEAVQPSATAFFDSLSEEQLASLMPQRPDRDGSSRGERGERRHEGQRNGPMDAPTPPAPDAAPAPATPPAPAPATNG